MITRLFKYKGEISVVTIVTILLGGLGWFIKVSTKEAVIPISHEMVIGFKGVDQQFGVMNEKIIQIDAKHAALSNNISRIADYQNTLRSEVKSIAESKVDKDDYWQELKTIDERMDTFEISSEVHKSSSSLHNGKTK